jgi:hypothetical protein
MKKASMAQDKELETRLRNPMCEFPFLQPIFVLGNKRYLLMKIRNLFFMAMLAVALGACNKPATTEATTTPTPAVNLEAPAADAPATKLETLTGTYIATEQGDYFHAAIKGDDGTEYSFFFAPDLSEARADELVAGMYDGKKVKATWRKTERDIPEAGGMMEVDELVDIEAI